MGCRHCQNPEDDCFCDKCEKCGGLLPKWDDTPHTEAHCTCPPYCHICRQWCVGQPGAWSCGCDVQEAA